MSEDTAEEEETRKRHEGMMRLSGGEELLLEELRAIAKHLDVIDVQLPVQGQWIEAIGALREPLDRIEKGTDALGEALTQAEADQIRSLREIRGELAGIRARLDSLVAIEKELAYQGQRLSAIEKRFAMWATTSFGHRSETE